MLAFILKLLGKTYSPDQSIPTSLVVSIFWQRAVWMARGMIRLRRMVFLGRSVRIRGGGRIAFGRLVTIEPGCQIDGYASGGVSLGDMCKLGSGTIMSCTSHMSRYGRGLTIGNHCGFGEYCYFGAAGGITIGNDVIAGQYVSFHSENHVFSDPGRKIREQGTVPAPISIGNDVWIGARVTFLAGATVSDHSVVAAGAVVAGQFPPNSLIGGVPARLIRSLVIDS